MSRTYLIDGMTCQHCVNAVSDEIGKIDGVTGVAVNLDRGLVTVTSTRPLEQADVAGAVDEAGYELAGVQP